MYSFSCMYCAKTNRSWHYGQYQQMDRKLANRGRMHEGRIAPLSAVIFYPAVKCATDVDNECA